MQVQHMANDSLKQIFHDMQSKIIDNVNPDSVSSELLSNGVIDDDVFCRLRQVSAVSDRCRDLLSHLHLSAHAQTFVYLRLALLDDYSSIVDEIDDKLTSLSCQLQQLHSSHSNDGKMSVNLQY